MKDKAAEFFERVHGKLDTLEGRLESIKLNIGTTWHFLQERLSELRQQQKTSGKDLTEARSKLQMWLSENESGTRSSIDEWVANRDTDHLAQRAQEVEENAWTAIMIAEASIDDAERMILEALSARLDVASVTHS
jgi:ElaB/YqjD/DUF883 family membrane-anchored ribosome-binding protein